MKATVVKLLGMLAMASILILTACGGTAGSAGIGSSGTSGEDNSSEVGNAMTVTGLSPSSGEEGTMLTIIGTNFNTIPVNNKVSFKNRAQTATFIGTVMSATPTSLTVTVPSNIDTYTVFIETLPGGKTVGGTVTSADSFILTHGSPSITSFYPTEGEPGKLVSIAGTNFSDVPIKNTVLFYGTAAAVESATSVLLTVRVPSGAEDGSISVKTANGFATSLASFIPYPTIASFNPIFGTPGDTITIIGSNFKATDAIYFWNGIKASEGILTSTKSRTVTVPNIISSGPISMKPFGANGSSSSAVNFTLNKAAQISSFVPTFGVAGTSVTIFGSNFAVAPADNLVKFCGVSAEKPTFLSLSSEPAFIKVTVPSGVHDSCPISITTVGGTSQSIDSFFISETPPPLPNNRLSVSQTSLFFTSITVGSYSVGSVNLTNSGTVNLHINEATVSGGNFEYRNSDCFGYNDLLEYYDTLAPGASCSVDVGFRAAVIGLNTGFLSISSTATGSPHAINLSATGTPPVTPVVSLSTASLNFATSELGSSSIAQAITLTNTGAAALNIATIGVSGEYVQDNTCPSSLDVGASCIINITFTPIRQIGTKQGHLLISSNEIDSPREVRLDGVGSLSKSGQLAIFTRQPFGIDSVVVDSAWIGGSLKYDSQNICGGVGALTLTLAPGTHSIEGHDPLLSIDPVTVTVLEGACTVHKITGVSTCLSPSFISDGICYANSPPTCTLPKVLQNGVCATPGTDIDKGASGYETDGGIASRFIGINADSCLSFGYLTSVYEGHDSQTIKNNCSFPVYVMRCHASSDLPGTSSSECNAAGSDRFYQQFSLINPGKVLDNYLSLPPGTRIWYGACSGGSSPSGKAVSLTGDYICN